MRVLFTKEHEGHPQGDLTELPDDQAQAAIGAGAAVETARLRFKRDTTVRGRVYPANFTYDLVWDDAAKKAVADGVAEHDGPVPKEAQAPPAVKEEAAPPRRHAKGGE